MQPAKGFLPSCAHNISEKNKNLCENFFVTTFLVNCYCFYPSAMVRPQQNRQSYNRLNRPNRQSQFKKRKPQTDEEPKVRDNFILDFQCLGRSETVHKRLQTSRICLSEDSRRKEGSS